jgi:predicted exporter
MKLTPPTLAFRHINLITWMLAMALMLAWIFEHIQVQSDMSLFLPKQSSFSEALLLHQLNHGSASRTIFISIVGGDETQRADMSKALTHKLQTLPIFNQTLNGQQQLSSQEISFLLNYRYLLSPNIQQKYFSAEQLSTALQQRLDELALPVPMPDKEFLPRDPSVELRSVLPRQPSNPALVKRNGVWFSKDGSQALIIVVAAANAVDLDRQQQVIDAIKNNFDTLNSSQQLSIELTGLPAASVQSREIIQHESRWFSIAASLVMLIILLLWFRSFKLVLLSGLPIASAIISGLFFVLLWFQSIHGITLVFAITLLGIAIDYPLHFFSHLEPGQDSVHSIKKIWGTIKTGLLTTVTAFATLMFSNFDGLVQLGLFTASGLIAAALTTRYVLPTLTRNMNVRVGISLKPFVFSPFSSYLFIFVCLLISLAGWFTQTPQWEKNLSSLSPLPADYKQRDNKLRTMMGAGDLRFLALIPGDSIEQVLQHSETLQPALKSMQNDNVFSHYDMAARYLPSKQLQNQRKSALPAPDDLRQNLTEAVKNLPFKAHLFQPFIDDVSASKTRALLQLEDLSGFPFEPAIQSLLIQNAPNYFAIIRFSGISDESQLETRLAVAAQNSHVNIQFYDLEQISSSLLSDFYSEFLSIVSIAMLVIISILFVSLHNTSRVIAVVLALALTLGLEISLLVGIGQHFTLFHLVSLVLVFGLGLDYALFFIRDESAQDQKKTFMGLLICALSTFSVFGILALSKIPVLHIIGMTTALGVVLAFIISIPIASLFAQGKHKT